ncbi:bud emergence 1 [Trichoderma cornu-damae]|uniref:Bud emergence 1 n=1 Tax=Trichoderma cornu-damae TaxID=654480 RepID=A0A9P8QNJ1_9HYPO|nr:bud emergence 1 [Trichoderma cornu-damae]
MGLVQALRRSIKGDKEKQHSISITPKAAVAIVPPKKVIRALYDYDARSSQELSFSKGDFFHVIGREDDADWYEACNPALPDARGLVPVGFFQALGKTERDSHQSDGGRPPTASKNPDHDSGYGEVHSMQSPGASGVPASQRASKASKPGAMVYGVVMYDFNAERSDELEAKAGEAIIVIAQSNPEWFVAKPIGRLGGPGLIPVSFIELRDMGTGKAIENPGEAIRKAGVPKVEEWKKMATAYKNSSITLGKFEGGGPSQPLEQGMERMSIQNGPQPPQGALSGPAQPAAHPQQPEFVSSATTELYAPISARIPRYCFAEDKYWFVIETQLEDGRHWELSRYYEDFYDFQIALLTEFPAEAGNTGTQKRTLPYMPGPVSYVTDAITEGRLHNLDAYVKHLLNQPPYIARCTLVKQFFAPREGDYEMDPATVEEEYRLSQGSRGSSSGSHANPDSRQSSRNNLSGNGYSGLSATPRKASNPQQGMQQLPPQQMPTQPQQSQQQSQPQPQAAAAMKIKMYYNGDLIAIRVPTDIQYQQLHDKIRDRLKVSPAEQVQLFYKDESSGDKPRLANDADLDYALERNEKLMLYVEVV